MPGPPEYSSGIRDNWPFPGTAKKTLQDRASNPSSPWERDNTDMGEQDLSQWPVYTDIFYLDLFHVNTVFLLRFMGRLSLLF